MNWFITGSYGHGNLGDDLLIYNLCINIHRIDPDASFFIHYARNGSFSPRLPPEVSTKTRFFRSIPSGVGFLRKCDVMIFGGGTLVHITGAGPIYWNILAKLFSKKVYWLNVGADGPPKQLSLYLKARAAISLCDQLTVRDSESIHQFRRLSYRKILPAQLSADLMFLEPPPLRQGLQDSNGPLVVSWHHFRDDNLPLSWHEITAQLAKLLLLFAATHHLREIAVAPMNLRQDPPACDILLNHLENGNHSNAQIQRLQLTSHDEQLACVDKSRFLISSRMHPWLIAKYSGRSAVAFEYANKVTFQSRLFQKQCTLPPSALQETRLDSALRIVNDEFLTPSRFRLSERNLREKALISIQLLQKLSSDNTRN